MPRPSALTRAKSEIQQALLQEGRAIHTRKDIADIFYRNRHAWALPQRVSINRFLDFVTKTKLLQAYDLQSHKYARSTTRYAHGEASPLAMAVTLSPRAYLSHGTALGLHGLHQVRPQVELQRRESILPPDLFEQYSKLSFWQDQAHSRANVITAKPSASTENH